MYYWKSEQIELSPLEIEALTELKTQKLFIRFFEVEPNSKNVGIPVAKIQLYDTRKDLTRVKIVPVVYIQNDVFKKSGNDQELAENVNYLIRKYQKERFSFSKKTDEIQIDCDWTPSTTVRYFSFLRDLKRISGKKISVTLRLYPYKYPEKMGVPPADRVTLMCYNLISPLAHEDKNSIFDMNEFLAYIRSAKRYPIKADVALPLFSWIQVFHHGKFEGLIYLTDKELKKISVPTPKPMWHVVKTTTQTEGILLRPGDKLKVEKTDIKTLEKLAGELKVNVNLSRDLNVSFFALDQRHLRHYENKELLRIYNRFK